MQLESSNLVSGNLSVDGVSNTIEVHLSESKSSRELQPGTRRFGTSSLVDTCWREMQGWQSESIHKALCRLLVERYHLDLAVKEAIELAWFDEFQNADGASTISASGE